MLDGEIVAFSGGRTDFARLQRRMGLTRRQDVAASGVAVTYYVFDLLRLDGADTRNCRCGPASRCCAGRRRTAPRSG
ncbi:hypothetical protein [Streptomyces coeruleorubidus]|uniref:hypothetical protein n=1 Tax=Streptomyces coeruleorubidus TaxID=116188 RepID=UPI003F540CCC